MHDDNILWSIFAATDARCFYTLLYLIISTDNMLEPSSALRCDPVDLAGLLSNVNIHLISHQRKRLHRFEGHLSFKLTETFGDVEDGLYSNAWHNSSNPISMPRTIDWPSDIPPGTIYPDDSPMKRISIPSHTWFYFFMNQPGDLANLC